MSISDGLPAKAGGTIDLVVLAFRDVCFGEDWPLRPYSDRIAHHFYLKEVSVD